MNKPTLCVYITTDDDHEEESKKSLCIIFKSYINLNFKRKFLLIKLELS